MIFPLTQVRFRPFLCEAEFARVLEDHDRAVMEGDALHSRVDTTLRGLRKAGARGCPASRMRPCCALRGGVNARPVARAAKHTRQWGEVHVAVSQSRTLINYNTARADWRLILLWALCMCELGAS